MDSTVHVSLKQLNKEKINLLTLFQAVHHLCK